MGADNFLNSETVGAHNRQAKRARVLLSAKLETPTGEMDCRLRDLSRKGALIECKSPPPTGAEVFFRRGSITVPARVAWSQPGRCGLEFHYMIDEAEAMVQLKSGGSQSQQRFRRPGIKEGVSDAERKLAAAWGIQVGINIPDGSY